MLEGRHYARIYHRRMDQIPPIEPLSAPAPAEGLRILRPLRIRDFALLFGGTTVSMFGDGIYLVAIAWQVYELSNAPTALSIVGVAWTLPMVLFLLVGGVMGDRFDRRRLMIAADTLRALAIGGDRGAGAGRRARAVAGGGAGRRLRRRRGDLRPQLPGRRARRRPPAPAGRGQLAAAARRARRLPLRRAGRRRPADRRPRHRRGLRRRRRHLRRLDGVHRPDGAAAVARAGDSRASVARGPARGSAVRPLAGLAVGDLSSRPRSPCCSSSARSRC